MLFQLIRLLQVLEWGLEKFKQWIKDIKKKLQKMSEIKNEDILKIAYVTCKGSVGIFIKRYLTEMVASCELLNWNDLKQLLKK